MTKVRIDLNLTDGTRHPLPVEIRRLNLALVDHGVSTQEFELDEGSYYVTSILPEGRKLFGYGEVSGPETSILLSVDSDSTQPGTLASDDLVLEFDPAQGGDLSALLEIHQFRGNIISGDLVHESRRFPDRLWVWESGGPLIVRGFYVTEGAEPAIIQILKRGVAPLNIVIPAYSHKEWCKVLISIEGEGQPRIKLGMMDQIAELLLQYLTNGYLREAATLMQSKHLALTGEVLERFAPRLLIKLYALLRLGELSELAAMIDDSGQWIFFKSDSPDGSSIRGEILARLGRHDEAFAAFLELASRGVPVFNDGANYAIQRLSIYRRLEMGSLKQMTVAESILRLLRRIATFQIPGYPVVAYTGINLSEPDDVAYSEETAREYYRQFDSEQFVGARLGQEPELFITAQAVPTLPLSIGIETLGGVVTRFFERNAELPVSKSQLFSTGADNQTSVEVHILQGERPMAADNRSLGKFLLSGIRPAPRSIPQIEVTFSVGLNGVLTVTAKDLETGRVEQTSYEASADLSAEEVDRLVREAEAWSEFDQLKLQLTEALQRIESLIDRVTKQITYSDRASDRRDIRRAELAIAEAEKAVQAKDLELINQAFQQLQNASTRLTQRFASEQAERAETATASEANTEFDADVENS